MPADLNVSGYLDLTQNAILVNENESKQRQTFTIAHELGHFLLHREELGNIPDLLVVYRDGKSDNALEKEANHFAANLLVPDFLLNQYSFTPDEILAKVFGVSLDVVQHRRKARY